MGDLIVALIELPFKMFMAFAEFISEFIYSPFGVYKMNKEKKIKWDFGTIWLLIVVPVLWVSFFIIGYLIHNS